MIPSLKRDDFNYVHRWWDYHRDGIPKGDDKALHNGNGFLLLRLSNPVQKNEFNVGISEYQNIYGKKYPYLSVETRIKLLTPLHPGSRGWGFWKSTKGHSWHSIAWFMQQKDQKRKALSWNLVGAVQGKKRRVKTWQPDVGSWHVYRIERDLRTKTTRFWVDDKPYLVTNGLVPRERLSFHLWIDNQVYSRKEGIRRQQWVGREAMIVDYVQIRTRKKMDNPIQIDNAHIVFYKNFNTILHGNQNFSAGKYRFHSNSDSVWLLLTARAEDLSPYDVPDRLQVFLDNESQSLLTVDGSILKGKTRTFFKKIALQKGQHEIRLQAQATPLLYDLLLLDAQGAQIIFQTSERQKTPERFAWALSQESTYLMYAAVTAREAPDFDQIHWSGDLERNDDDVSIVLTKSKTQHLKKLTFCGNKIFGDCRTKLLSGVMKAGSYNLSIQKEGHPQIRKILLIRWPH